MSMPLGTRVDIDQIAGPGNKAADGMLEIMAAYGPTGGGAFSIDPEQAQQCIDQLRGVVLDLGNTLDRLSYARFSPPAADPVSINLAVQGGIMAQRAHDYVLAWREQIAATATALEEQLRAYRAAEDGNARRLT